MTKEKCEGSWRNRKSHDDLVAEYGVCTFCDDSVESLHVRIRQLNERDTMYKGIIKVITDSDENITLSTLLKHTIEPFGDPRGGSMGSTDETWDWYEESIFNEERLYKALGKDRGRTVLGIWNRFREVCELVYTSTE